ncbi:Transmembrane protein (PGPGW) [Sphingomonas antarctica]|uniref:hypothetical protein n=1 Tax=Sphingomonas antarctica TaxID=2040274 RepID=UPI0039EC2589
MRRRWRSFEASDGGRLTLVVTGIFLMAISPLIGALPGPGFIIVFPLGLGMTLRYSKLAKRLYVRFKRRWPKHGSWVDWGLRRASAKRRAELEKAQVAPSIDSAG